MDHSHSAAYHYAEKAIRHPASLRSDERTLTEVDLPKRRYDIMYLDQAGHFQEKNMLARAHAAFELAFCVLKQGSLVTSERGIVNIEEVMPGDTIQMADHSHQTVQWRGQITLNPHDEVANGQSPVLTRFTSDAMGYNRPTNDLVLGHGARILHRAAGIKRVSGSDEAFIPAADFVDGNNVLSLQPQTPVSMFQFGFEEQQNMLVNGVEVESLHPGSAFNLGLRGSSLRAFMSLFPHKRSFEDFGMMRTPRLRLRDLELLG